MKTLFKTLLIASAIVSAAACNTRIEPASLSSSKTFTASREAVAPATKSVLQDGGSVLWAPAEEISVFLGAGTAGGDKFTSTNTDAAATVEFSGTLSNVGTEADYWAVYPYSADNECDGRAIITVIPAEQEAVEGNFSGNVFPAVAKSADNAFAFWNICGGLKFSVTRSDIKTVLFKGDGGEALAGKVKVTFGTDGKPEVSQVITPSTDVTVTAPGGGTFVPGKFYYITLLPGTLNSGFWMQFTGDTADGTFNSNKPQTIKRSVFGVIENADANVTSWNTVTATTIKDFAEQLVTILDVWQNTTGTIDMLKGESYEGGEWNVADAHYVPDATTITVGGKTYNTADMFETAIRSYLLVRGYDGLDTEKYGKGSIPALAGGAQAMSTTPVPETHGYYWGASPYNETTGNGGHFVMGTKTDNEPCKIKLDALDNWAMRSLNFQHGKGITNLCGYAGGQLAGYYGCFCSKRALLTYTFFFKYMLDNKLDTADAIDASTIFRTELFGDENKQPAPITLKTQWLFSAARMAPASEGGDGYEATFSSVDASAGDGGKYIEANGEGKGRITWVQEDKTGLTNSDRVKRVVGSTGHPYAQGIWYGDYWLFEVPSDVELPAGTKIHIKYIARSSDAGPKYWMGEYYDNGEWKTATMEVIEEAYNFAIPVETTLKDRNGDDETFSYNIKMKENGSSNTTIESYFVLTAPTSKIQYRQRVTGLYRASDGTTAITGLGKATSRIAGSDYNDAGVTTSPLIEVVNE